jgi:hypothetical protein
VVECRGGEDEVALLEAAVGQTEPSAGDVVVVTRTRTEGLPDPERSASCVAQSLIQRCLVGSNGCIS